MTLPTLRFWRSRAAGLLSVILVIGAPSFWPEPAFAQVCVTQPGGAVAWYPGDGDTRDFARANTGALHGNTTYGTVGAGQAFAGQAFVLDGTSDAVTVGNPAQLQLQTLTIEAWVKRASGTLATNDPSGLGVVFGYDSGGPGVGGYVFYLLNDGRLGFGHTSGVYDARSTTPAIIDTAFHHVAVVKTGTSVTFYVDGVADARTYAYPFTFTTNAAIGAHGGTFGSGFNGVIDELAIYDRALSASDVQAISTAGAGAKCKQTRVSFEYPAYPNGEASGPFELTVRRTGDATGASTISYATSDGTALAGQDYTATSGTLSFAAGEAAKTFQVPVTNDVVAEADETLQGVLSNPTGAALVAPSAAALTIFNTVPGPGRIVTSAGISYNNALFAFNTDGSNEIALTPENLGGTRANNPSVARRTGQIAFDACGDYPTGDCNDGYRIFVMNADGSGRRAVTTSAGLASPQSEADTQPVISPDGTKIAFLSARPPARYNYPEVFVVNTDGTGLHVVTATLNAGTADESYARSVAWSPDSAKLLVHAFRGGGAYLGLYTFNPDGTGETLVVPLVSHSLSGAIAIDWAPDGRHFLYYSPVAPSGAYVIADALNPSSTRLLDAAQLGPLQPYTGTVRFSPDSQRIVYVASGPGSGSTSGSSIRTFKIDGTDPADPTNVSLNRYDGQTSMWWWGGPPLPVAARFALTPASILVWSGHGVTLTPTLYDASDNVIFHAASFEASLVTGRQCGAPLPACTGQAVFPAVDAFGTVTGASGNGEVNWCAGNAGFTGCMRVQNYDTPVLSVNATTPNASRANGGAAGVFTISRFGRTGTALETGFSLAGTAVRNTDYTIDVSGGTLTGSTITTLPGQDTVTVNVRALSSGGGAGDETVIFTLLPTAQGTYVLNNAATAATVTVKDDASAVPSFRLTAISPNAGGDLGSTSVTISGEAIAPGATARLARSGQSDIASGPVTVAGNGLSLTTAFSLAGKARGTWTVIVTNPAGQAAALTEGFTIEEGRATDVWMAIVGSTDVRRGRQQTFHFAWGNTGNVDADATMFRIYVPRGLRILSLPRLPDGSLPAVLPDDGASVLEFFLPNVAALSSAFAAFIVTTPPDLPTTDGGMTLRAVALSSPTFRRAAAIQIDPTVSVTTEVVESSSTYAKKVFHVTSSSGNSEIVAEATFTDVNEDGPTTYHVNQTGTGTAFEVEYTVARDLVRLGPARAQAAVQAEAAPQGPVLAQPLGAVVLASISPMKASGAVTATIRGQNIEPGAKVKLTRTGQSAVEAKAVSAATDRRSALVAFQFKKTALGVWDVVVTNPDGASSKLAKAFTVEAAFVKVKEKVTSAGDQKAAEKTLKTAAKTPDGVNVERSQEMRKDTADSLVIITGTATGAMNAAINATVIALWHAARSVDDPPYPDTPGDWPTFPKWPEPIHKNADSRLLELTPFSTLMAPFGELIPFHQIVPFQTIEQVVLPNVPKGPSLLQLLLQVVFSWDPNEKSGPQGGGEAHFITTPRPMPYVVLFENNPAATAPAQDVTITDQLDVAAFDLSTFRLGPVGFGNRLITPPAGLSQWTSDVDLRPSNDLIVRVTAGLDTQTGIARWAFVSLDPGTLLPTANPLAGFLPPNTAPPQGEGSVIFTIQPRQELPTGTEIRNQAQIVFDANAPIDTPVWVNTVDNARPTSQVTALPATQASTSFEVSWAGSDAGAGIDSYRIYVSEDDQPFSLWLADTSATSAVFAGDLNKRYGFYSIARDVAGNVQPTPLGAQATTLVTFTPSADDLDGDGLVDAWEQQFGLLSTSASGVNGAAGDADGDGVSNAQEQIDGTHPRGAFVRYFAEGATGAFFSTAIALANPSATEDALVLLRFMKADGTASSHALTVPAHSRQTVEVASLPSLEAGEFSAIIESNVAAVADRTMQWDRSGYGGHAETAIPSPGQTWYLAEGATHSGFDLFYLIQNPGGSPATIDVTYLLPAPAAPIVKSYTVGANSRFNIWVDNDDPRLANTDVSATVTSPDALIIVERAMYLNAGGTVFAAGHESAGVTSPATNWFLAEGATGQYFDLFVLIANPNAAAAAVDARYLLPDGSVVVKSYAVPGNSRFNIWVDLEDTRLADTAVSTTLTSTNGVPIIVERTMWWPGSAATWQEAHNSPGSSVTGTRWALAEGELGGTNGKETYVLIANTSPVAGSAKVTLLFEDGSTAEKMFALSPNSRFNVAVGAEFPQAAGKRFGAMVDSQGATPAQIVVERAMYWNARGQTWATGTNALATKLQ